MKIIIFEYVEQLTGRYHCDGGLVIIARDVERAKELISKDKYINPTQEEWEKAFIYELKEKQEERYFVFPDAGCC